MAMFFWYLVNRGLQKRHFCNAPEQHNKRASFGSEIDVGHRVMILSVDDKGNACVDVVRGHLNKGIDAFYEFPDVEEIKEVIKNR